MQANHKMTVAAFALSSLAMMVSGIGTGFAQNMVRVRGTIDHIERSAYLVKARDGAELRVALDDNPQIAGVAKAPLSDIKQGSSRRCRGLTAARAHWRYISFLRLCAEPEKDTIQTAEHNDQRER